MNQDVPCKLRCRNPSQLIAEQEARMRGFVANLEQYAPNTTIVHLVSVNDANGNYSECRRKLHTVSRVLLRQSSAA